MRKAIPLFVLAMLATLVSFAGGKPKRTCATMNVLNRLKAEDPSLEARMQQIEVQTADYIKANKNAYSSQAVITIPVVFHVLYRTGSQNLTTEQCQAQVDQLNLDFAHLNKDSKNTPSAFGGVAANVGIQFCLATRDPKGLPTTGVERRQTTKSSFNMSDGVKYYSKGGLDAWPSSSYLNIWSCNLGQGLLGYAQFPGGKSATDGVVLLYSSIGSMAKPGTEPDYDLGRTGTHEVGHWLNLYHIWGDDGSGCSGSDKVSDTPNQAGENYGCPSFPLTDACSSSSPGVMFMNYMDYTDDACMNMFTNGQATRCKALFASGGSRAGILSSNGCVAPSSITTSNDISSRSMDGDVNLNLNEMSVYPNPSYGTVNVAFTSSVSVDGITTIKVTDLMGNIVASQQVSVTSGNNKYFFDLNSMSKGIYFVELTNSSERLIRRFILDK